MTVPQFRGNDGKMFMVLVGIYILNVLRSSIKNQLERSTLYKTKIQYVSKI